MPDVLFDPRFRSQKSDASGYTGSAGPFYSSGNRAIAIFTAGVLPTNMEEFVCFNDIPNAVIPNAGMLLHWTSWDGHTIAITGGGLTDGLITLTTSAALAIQSGTAAEFLYYGTDATATTKPTPTQVIRYAVKGSVTLAGGGGDLIINNLNIVAGSSYSIAQWRHRVFQDFSYV